MDVENTPNLRRIVICLLRFDLWVFETIADGQNLNEKERLENIVHHFKHQWQNPPLPNVINGWLQSPELYHSQTLPELEDHLNTMSQLQLSEAIMNKSAKDYYTRMLLKRILKVREQKTVNNFASQDLERAFEESQGLLIMQRPRNRTEYLVMIMHKLDESRRRLRVVTREATVFRDAIGEAIRTAYLNPAQIERLRGKLEALNEYYDDAYKELRREEVPPILINDRKTGFW